MKKKHSTYVYTEQIKDKKRERTKIHTQIERKPLFIVTKFRNVVDL